ncbi:polycystin-1-like protein 2 [Argopecten irradians]|uniref:polycystin-1-like protein 2 n=1 Tax=Argopecten irradians TaxID=31199 RepID=UPI00371FAED5
MVDGGCTDKNECLSFPCHGNAHCNNTNGSYTCTCFDGFVSVGDTCEDINECEVNPGTCPASSDCVNIDGGHLCVCLTGYNKVNDICEDVNECKTPGICHSNSQCSNTDGSYSCVCEEGFLDRSTYCEDINECLSGVCGENADCLNTKGSYQCSCTPGYTSINNNCQDINECLYGVCSSNANCTNIPGSYTCTCHTGYIDIGTECEDINECNDDPPPCPSNSACDNTAGSYTCTCDTGYVMVDSGSCNDVNECLWSPCMDFATCTNTLGSYQCLCLPGFRMDGNTCVDINECTSGPCPSHSKCQNILGNYTCVCENGFYQKSPYECLDARVFNTTIRVLKVNDSDAVFTDELTDAGSQLYTAMTFSYTASVARIFSDSGFGDNYLGTSIGGYADGSIIIVSSVYFHVDSTAQETDIVDSLESGIPVLRSEGLEVLPEDISVIAINECDDEDWNSCSSYSTCTQTSGVYTCSCFTGYMDIGVGDDQPPGTACAVINENNQDPITGFTASTEFSFYRVGDSVVFTLQLTRGSHVKYTANYGDGGMVVVEDPESLAFLSPVTITHSYSVAGNYTVTISADNTVSQDTVSHQVFVQDSIENFLLDCKETNLNYPGDIAFLITSNSLTPFANIHIDCEFGDGNVVYEYVGDTQYNSNFTFTHTFNPGVYQTTVNISNMVSFLIAKKTFIIEEPISGLSVASSKNVITKGTEIVLTIRTLTGSNISLNVDFGNNQSSSLSLNNIRRGQSSVHIPLTYTKVDTYMVTVVAKNVNSTQTAVSPFIFVQNPVRDIVLEVFNPLVLSPPGDVYSELSFTGGEDPPSHMVCLIMLNNTYASSVYIEIMDNSFPTYLNTSWDNVGSVGDIEMFVNCSNKLNSVLLINWITIQRKIEGMSINANKLYIPVNGQVNFDFYVEVGSHAKYEISFKDGHVLSGSLEQDIFYNKQIPNTHTFQQKGLYDVTFTVRNAVWTAKANLEIWVLTEVKGLAFVRYYAMSDRFDLPNYGHGGRSNIFPLERDIIINASVSSGNNLMFDLICGDGVTLTSTDEVMRRKFDNPGTYSIKLNASNQLFYDIAEDTITLQQIVQIHTISNNGPSDAYETITYVLELARPGTNSCFIWDMGDGSQETIYGESLCEDIARTNKYIYANWLPTGVLEHSHMYRTNGTFTVNVTGFNTVSSQTVTDLSIVTGISCFYPKVHIEGGGQQIDLPVHYYRSDRIILESTAEVNCKASQEVSYEWKIYKIDEGKTYLDYIFNEYHAPLVATDRFRILLPPSTFVAGHYKIESNVSMFEIHGLSSVHFTYLNITQTPLFTSFVGGIMRSIGFNTEFDMDALTDSYDPDVLDTTNKTGLTFSWRCRLAHEVFPTGSLPTIEIPTTEERQNMTWGEGCFGTGIGNLDIETGIFSLDSFLFQPKSENVFEVVVRKDERTSITQQTLVVVDGEPKQLHIKCEINCNSKMNPSGEFLLLGSCRDCTPFDTIHYKWSLFLQNLTTLAFEEVVELPDFAVADISSSVLVLKPATLTGGRKYRLKLEAQIHGYADSFTVYEFVTNLPPYGGMCSVIPEKGFALETTFTIACHGWKNHGEDQENLEYTFWLSPLDSNHNQLVFYGRQPYTPDSQFPLGPSKHNYTIDIIVRIQNPIGEYIETPLEVQVMNPTKDEDVDSLITLASGENNEISNLLLSGKSQEAKQLIVAMVSLINDSPLNFAGDPLTVLGASTTVQMWDNTTFPNTTTMETTTTASRTTTTGTTTVPTTVDPVQAEEDRLKKEQEEKAKRIQFREVLATTLTEQTDSLTINSLQQTAMCFAVVTHEPGELSDNTQDIVVSSMLKMANSLDALVDNSKSESMDQEWDTAVDMLASLGSVAMAAVDMSLEEVLVSASVTVTRNTQSPTQPVGNDDLNTTHAHSTTTESTRASTSMTNKELRRQKVKEIATKVMEVTEIIYQTAIKTRVPGGPPLRLEAEHMSIVAERREVKKLIKAVLDVSSGSFAMPSSDEIVNSTANTSYIDSKVLSATQNTYVWDDSSSKIKTPVLSLSLYDSDKNEIPIADLKDDITIDIILPTNPSDNARMMSVSNLDEKLTEFVVEASSNDTSIHFVIRPEEDALVEVYVRYNVAPTVDIYDNVFLIPNYDAVLSSNVEDSSIDDELAHTVFISPEFVQEHGIGSYVIAIKPFENKTGEVETYDDYYADYVGPTIEDEIRVNFSITYRTSGCLFWNASEDRWMSDGCRVSPLSNSKYTRCLCNHLTSFGADFYTPPNKIDFNTVFDNIGAKIADNWAVLATLCTIFGLFFVLAIWARHKDRLDVVKWGVAPLSDNVVSDPYYYQIAVFTGMRRSAGTRSKISFVLAGDNEDTGVRNLADEKGIKVCSRGSVNNYVMSTQQWLGPLTYLRIWHDNKGKGKQQGWYLSKVVVSDLQTGQTYYFMCNRWLAVEEDDGMIDRMLPVAGTEDLTRFNTLFLTKTKRSLTDSHLWISVFSRPQRSHFTRVQRLSCILSLVMTTMVANAMFYRSEDNVENKESFVIGPIEFSLSGLYISFISSLVVLPVNLIIDHIFRKTRPRQNKVTNSFVSNIQPLRTLSQVDLRPCKVDDDTKISDVTDDDFDVQKQNLKSESADTIGAVSTASDKALINRESAASPSLTKPKQTKAKFSLPPPCIYIAWALVFLSSVVSGFITFLYSMEWGKEKSLAWLSAMLLSIGESITVIQPAKIITIAVIISALLKKPDVEEIEEDDDTPVAPKRDEELLFTKPTKALRPLVKVDTPDPVKLAEARKTRLNEIHMHQIIREIIFYFIFLALILLVASHNRDPKAYTVKTAMLNMLNPKNAMVKVKTVSDFWFWLEKILLPNMYLTHKWNGDLADDEEQRLISTRTAYRVGPIRIRQQRVKREGCIVSDYMRNIIPSCAVDWDIDDADDKAYSESWKLPKINESFTHIVNYPWKYRSFLKTGGLPYAGEIGVYPGGGYIADFIGKRERAFQFLSDLRQKNWIDRFSRAIFVMFTVYNANVNMFSTVNIVFEMPNTGEFMVKENIHTFRLFSYLGGYGIFIIFCEVSAAISVVYFFVRECKRIRKEKKNYFKSFWNVLEMLTMMTALGSIVMYLIRHFITAIALSNVTKLRDKFYNFEKVAMWDEVFGYVMAFTIFASIIKLIHMFRFNRKMSMIAGTLKNSTSDISAFSVVFLVFLSGFAIWGYIMFGPNMASYKSMIQSIETLLAFSLGEYDYLALVNVNRIFGPLFFFSFFLFVNFILLNVFVTILNESITAVRKDVSKQSNEFEIVNFAWTRFKGWIGIDLDRILLDVQRKYMIGKGDEIPPSVDDSMKNIASKLDTIISRLEKLDQAERDTHQGKGGRRQSSPQIIIRSDTPLFTRLFPTIGRQKINLE